MSFPRYPEYKDSGVEWLGEVPSHWDIHRLKRVCVITPSNVDKKSVEGERSVLLCNYTDVYYNDEITADLSFMEATATESQVEKFSLLSGDTIITKDSETADDIGVSAYVPETLPSVVCGYHLSVLRPRESTYGRYVKRLFDSAYFKAQLEVSANGLTRVGLSQYALDNLLVATPPREEQIGIATFLDRETAKIDALVAEQEKLIELLKEKRQAVITHAVTKGLDPNAPMKDSGIEWLGEVPAHWELKRLKFLCRIETGDKDTANATDDGAYPFFVRSQTVERINTFTHDCEAVLTAGDGAGVGKVFHHHVGPFAFHQRVYMMCDFRGVAGRYIYYYLKENFYKVALEGGAKSTVDSLRMPVFANFVVCVPLADEQKKILDAIERSDASTGELIRAANDAIALLTERRSALISAAVTGKIDVRGLAQYAQQSAELEPA